MRSKTINLLESIQQSSITNVIDKVAEQFKSEIIEEYKASETKEMSTELENKITKALALEGVDSPEDWVADVCSVALDMTPTGEALAIKEDENTKGQLKQLGIDDIINDLVHKEDTFRYQMLSRLQMDCDYFLGNGNRADKHLWAGNVPDHIKIMRALYNSFSDDKKPEWISMEDIDNYEKEMTDTLKESAALDKIGNVIKENENTDIKGQLKQLGIKSIYVSDEHKRADEDELNKLGGLEYNYRLQRNPSKAHYYSYLSIKHETLGDIYISFDIKTNKIDTTGFPWNFIEKAMTPEIKEFVETNEEFFNNLLKSKELGTGINLNESEDDNEAMFKRIKDATGYDDEYCRKIIEDGDYVWFKGVSNDEELGKAYVDMVGMQGISDKSKYIDEEKYRDSWRELAEESIREENPNLDEDEFEAEVEKWLDAVVPEQLEIAKLDGENLDEYFDYEALGRDLNFEDYYFVDDGCIGIFN